MTWDPDRYLGFADLRSRPGLELIARILHPGPERVVDLGCGTGQLTAVLARRWPEALVSGIDSSPEMLKRALIQFSGAEWSSIEWQAADIASWQPAYPVDVIFSNAALHWVHDHSLLFPSLMEGLQPGGVLAVQMPDNWDEPSHRLIGHLADHPRWRQRAAPAFTRHPVHLPEDYRRWLEPIAAEIDLWRTTYHHHLEGADPVLAWVKGSILPPILAQLNEDEAADFERELAALYSTAYTTAAGGATVYPFNRLFIVAVKR